MVPELLKEKLIKVKDFRRVLHAAAVEEPGRGNRMTCQTLHSVSLLPG